MEEYIFTGLRFQEIIFFGWLHTLVSSKRALETIPSLQSFQTLVTNLPFSRGCLRIKRLSHPLQEKIKSWSQPVTSPNSLTNCRECHPSIHCHPRLRQGHLALRLAHVRGEHPHPLPAIAGYLGSGDPKPMGYRLGTNEVLLSWETNRPIEWCQLSMSFN